MTDDEQAGKVKIENGHATLEFTRFLAHPPQAVWEALTDPAHFNAWYNAAATIDGRLGGSFEVLSGPFHWTGPILARDPPTLLAYEHNHEPCPEMPSGARTIVRWELSPEGEGTRPSDVYEWMPSRFFVLHTAYGRIGIMDVGGIEIISYDAASKTYRSHFFDSKGNISTHELTVQGDTWTWKGERTGCTAAFTDHGKTQTAHHIRSDGGVNWVPCMEVTLTTGRGRSRMSSPTRGGALWMIRTTLPPRRFSLPC